MARNFFARSSPRIGDAGKVDNDAHGCPACPHMPARLESTEVEGEYASTLLPHDRMTLDGKPFEFAPLHDGWFESETAAVDVDGDDLAFDGD